MRINITEIFCYVDDFQESDKHRNSVTQNNDKSSHANGLNRSEVMTTIIGYWQSSCDHFKNQYLKRMWIHHQRDF